MRTAANEPCELDPDYVACGMSCALSADRTRRRRIVMAAIKNADGQMP